MSEFGRRESWSQASLKKERRQWSAEEKTRLLRRHLIEKIPISQVCSEAQLAPSLFHRWQELLFTNATLALAGKRGSDASKEQERLEKLEKRILWSAKISSEPARGEAGNVS